MNVEEQLLELTGQNQVLADEMQQVLVDLQEALTQVRSLNRPQMPSKGNGGKGKHQTGKARDPFDEEGKDLWVQHDVVPNGAGHAERRSWCRQCATTCGACRCLFVQGGRHARPSP